VAVLPAVALASCQPGSGEVVHLSGPPARILIVKGSILAAIAASDRQFAREFAPRTTYAAGAATAPQNLPRVRGTVEPTAVFKSYSAFAREVATGRLPRTVHAVLYDPEKWPGTPLAEQRDPRAYMVQFSQLARAHGLAPILAPARDLVLVPGAACAKRTGENLTRAYLRCRLAAGDAGAEVFVVQSQIDELGVPAFRHLLALAAQQARAGNPHVAVLAQLATAPNGQVATAGQLVAAARSVAGLVQGFSLNARASDLQAAASVLDSLKPS
jgi:hypothetical protein